ncbi:MAG: L-type lectin-domain containing protein [Bacteroidota bacterium]
MRTTIIFCLLLLAGFPLLTAQVLSVEDFTLRGDAYIPEGDCIRLTEAYDYGSGSMWYRYPLSLAEPFTLSLNVMVGCQDTVGADGIVFVMTGRANQLGYMGEGMGFAGLVPSVGIELDTWRNYHLGDPAEDHVAIMFNGRVGHYKDFAVPSPIKNIEDCSIHVLSVIWNPRANKLSVNIDNEEITSTNVDLIKNVFGGLDQVYWGVTAATGRYNNVHEVCFPRLSFYSPESEDFLDEIVEGN